MLSNANECDGKITALLQALGLSDGMCGLEMCCNVE